VEKKRQIIYFKNYFYDFFDSLSEKVKDKIDYVLFLITVADRIPKKFFQYMEGTDGLFEIRLNLKATFIEFSVVLMKENWWSFLMDSKRKLRKRHQMRLIKHLK
jgi:hypothetical protein